jgi:hypothetical protein
MLGAPIENQHLESLNSSHSLFGYHPLEILDYACYKWVQVFPSLKENAKTPGKYYASM